MHDGNGDHGENGDHGPRVTALGAAVVGNVLRTARETPVPPSGPRCRMAWLALHQTALAVACGGTATGVGSFDLDSADLPAFSAANAALVEMLPTWPPCDDVCGAPTMLCTTTSQWRAP